MDEIEVESNHLDMGKEPGFKVGSGELDEDQSNHSYIV